MLREKDWMVLIDSKLKDKVRGHWFLKHEPTSESLGDALKTEDPPSPSLAQEVCIGPMICVSHTSSGDVEAAGPRTILWELLFSGSSAQS